MKISALHSILEDLGLTKSEADFYLAALSLGSSTIQSIATEAGVKRTTGYSVMESLKQKGLMSVEVKGFKQRFVATSPENLHFMIDQRRKRFLEALPELSALQNLGGEESFIKYYEGLDSIKNVYTNILDSLKKGDEYLVISDSEHWFNLDKDFFEKYIEKRAQLGLKLRVLLQDSENARNLKKFEKNYGFRVKILPKDTHLLTDSMIVKNKLYIHQLTPPTLLIEVDTKSVVQMHREMFEIIWKSLK